jgi:hypothetical protein
MTMLFCDPGGRITRQGFYLLYLSPRQDAWIASVLGRTVRSLRDHIKRNDASKHLTSAESRRGKMI